MRRLDSYTERSPSGEGLRIFMLGKLPAGGRKRGNVEMYEHARFLTVTGNHWSGTPYRIKDRSSELTALHAEVFGTREALTTAASVDVRPVKLPDEDLLALARTARNGEKFAGLWDGAWQELGYASQSEADGALCMQLAFWTGRDSERVDRLFRQSGLYRAKWDEPHFSDGRTYGERTIQSAVERTPEVFEHDGARAILGTGRSSRVGTDLGGYPLTDLGNAQRLVAQHGHDLRFCIAQNRWLVWDGQRWRPDHTQEVMRRAKDTARSIYSEAAEAKDTKDGQALARHAMYSQSGKGLREMVALATSEPGIPVALEELDADPWALNCLNGTLDLRTGELRPHRREDLLTKMAPVAYDLAAECPRWTAFLARCLAGNVDLQTFLQRAIGYSLTASVREQVLFFLHGDGQNGKSTLLRTLQDALGEYAKQAAPDLLLAKRGESHPTELADVAGCRLLVTMEVEDGRRWDEALVKQLTGGDKLKARFMRQDFFEFDPTHKLFIAANHKPEVRGTDLGIWRRIRLIPFTVTIPPQERDPDLPEKLRAEWPGILRWAVEGCLAWQREGLTEPAAVTAATEAYRTEIDVLEGFLADCCDLSDKRAKTSASDLYKAYEYWCKTNGEYCQSQRWLSRRLDERQLERERTGTTRYWKGLALLPGAKTF